MANCNTDGHIFGPRDVCLFCGEPKPQDALPSNQEVSLEDLKRAIKRHVTSETSACECGHDDRYHFDNGEGYVVCRYTHDCRCAVPAEPGEEDGPWAEGWEGRRNG